VVPEEHPKFFSQTTNTFLPVTTFNAINKRFEESQLPLHATPECDEPDSPSQQLLSDAHKEVFSDIDGIDGRVSHYTN
jgi:hypothetical protein